MEEPENIQMLRLLKSQNESRQQIYNHVKTLEKFFLGTSEASGCSCKLKPVWAKLQNFWSTTGEKQLKTYEDEINSKTNLS